MPQSCFPEAELTIFFFRSGEVKELLLEFDTYVGAGPDSNFPLFFVKTANYLAPEISAVLHKLVRIRSFIMCWKVGNITLVLKCDSANSCPCNYCPITITPVLSKDFECMLAKHLNNIAENKNLFPNLQFDFCKSLGTCDALLTITNFAQKTLDCGFEVSNHCAVSVSGLVVLNPHRMVVQAILRIPELLMQLGYHQLLAHQWLSWFAAWLTLWGARVRFPAMAVYYLHLFPCVITWFISSMAAVNWDRLNATTVLWLWAGWWCKILIGWLCKPSWEYLSC